MDCFVACAPRNDEGVAVVAYRCPKIAEPTRTWVAPNWIAVAKSALMPMDRFFKPLRAAIFAVSAKCGAGASSTGGMHIRPEIVRPKLSRQLAMNASASDGATPAFCGSSPVLSWTNNCGRLFWDSISLDNAWQML